MIKSLIFLAMCIVFAGYVIGFLRAGRANFFAKRFDRDKNRFAFWALTAHLALVSIATGYVGVKGLL